ncbi:hypothetical protein DRN63_04750 [Nanoarchaeota archaeon]|nr:MAG: hypothetical protein DRN63_04750 [Nanoarchaeota archaeon]
MVLVSFVVAVRNEADRIRACLDSILSQTYKDFEVVVVDGGSTDGTVEIVKQYVRGNPSKVRLLFDPGLGPGYARNLGAEAARGKVLAFIDGDDEINSEYLERTVRHFADPKVAGIFVQMIFRSRPRLWGRVQDTWKWMRWSRKFGRFPSILLKDVFWSVGGYNANLFVGEDYDLYIRIKHYIEQRNLKFEFEERAIIYVASEDEPKKIFNHGVWFGKGLLRLVKDYPRYGVPVLLWSIFNTMFPASIILPAILGFWTLQVLALIYLLFYSTVWLSLFIKSILKKNRPYPVKYILLAPFLQILVSIGVIIGATLSLMPQK